MTVRWFAAFAGMLSIALPDLPAPAQTELSASGRKHALLIGCTAYPELGRRYQLRGPSNDVALTRELLRDRFGYDDAEIVTLLHGNEPSRRPTHDNIVAAFEALIGDVAAGDEVFILLGGHGSQQKDDNPGDPSDDERDGLDEVFLPEDVTEWKLNKPLPKAIRDDQIGQWLDAIRARGAFVFFVADTCHSGTLNRGIEDEDGDEDAFYRERHVSPWLINPPEAFDDLPSEDPEAAADDDAPAGIGDVAVEQGSGVSGMISLFAVDDRTLEREHPMPPDNKRDGPSYGRLSYALNWVLARSRRPLTYRELAQQIRWCYEGWQWDDLGFMLGAPQELNREVLGNGRWQDRSAVMLARDELGRLSINVGLLHGANVGNIYRVYPPVGAEDDDVAAGCVKIIEATPTSARIESCAYDVIALASAGDLPAPGRCELAYAACSSISMTVAVAPWDPADRQTDCEAVKAIIRRLAEEPDSLIRPADADDLPDAVVVVDGDDLFLRRAFEASEFLNAEVDEAAQFPGDAFGPFPLEQRSDSQLARALHAMAKAMNIRRVATSEGEMVIGDPYDPAVMLEALVERWNPQRKAFEPVDAMKPLEAYDDDRIRVSVFNRGGAPVDVTILYVESAFRIRSYFPTAAQELAGGFDNRVVPGGEPAVAEFPINDSTTGLEDVIVVATLSEAGAPPKSFVFLEQPGLSANRGGDDDPTGLATPAGQLLARLAFGRGERGGNAAADIATYAVHRRSWTVRKRPAAEP